MAGTGRKFSGPDAGQRDALARKIRHVFICTLDASDAPHSIRGMNSQWIDRAERLRAELAHLRAAQQHAAPEPHLDEIEAYERVTIARWLREEFSTEQPEDTATLALFPDAAPDWPAGRR